ncbi:X-Pro dipeptidyl-peptidase [Pseudosporangium ferrugineum]|uniref:X-Pro dipeptidyl-peptidase n=1 Tax=Pseudosporangium ferrugineum TaxID=439699 RepID=A0A2T0S2Z8_9ACTN|nr:X-Pro dipeptidyl-peptidase [Pseudosporangium ferrugineum]
MPVPVPRVLLAVLLAALAVPAPAQAAPGGRPYVRGGETVPVYDYADAVRESVWVQTPDDADEDGMIGKSWDGSIANGVAATGVEGLETIVPISAISSWYDYMRYRGTLRATGYPSYLQSVVSDRIGECAAVTESLATDSEDDTADYNAFWRARDYRPAASRVHASVFVVHGVNDLNVTTRQFAEWWDELAERGVPRKIWLHRTGHVDPFDVRREAWVDTLHQWFDRWLQGLHNGIERAPRATVETAPGVFTDARDWPLPGTRPVAVRLGAGVASYTDASLSEEEAVADPGAQVPGRLALRYGPLTSPLRLSGSPSVRLRVRVDRPTTQLTARLVDYGTESRVEYDRGEGVRTLSTESCWGASTPADDACYFDVAERMATTDHAVLTRGWQDAAHHVSLRFATPLRPDRWYAITVPVNAYDVTVAAGHTLGLVLTQSDPEFTEAPNTGATVEVDLARSTLVLPVTGPATLKPTKGAPRTTNGLTAEVRPQRLLPLR